jgi:membrane protease YdiL (CAAX protease family)
MNRTPHPRPHPAPASSLAGLIARSPLAAYFILAFAGTWLIAGPLALTSGPYGLNLLPVTVPEGVDFLLVQLSAYTGPLLAAILVTAATEGRAGLRQLRRRIGQWRVGVHWYLIALFGPLLIWLVSYGAVLAGAPLLTLAGQPALLLTTFLPFVLLGLLLPSLGEEPGWRGFALPRLQLRYGPLMGSVILGGLHGLWHLPAFFTAAIGPFTPERAVSFLLTAVAVTLLFTWLFNNTGGSVLLAMLLHAANNAASGLMNRLVPRDLSLGEPLRTLVEGGWLNVVALGLVALLLVAFTRGRLSYPPDRPALPASSSGPVVALPPNP